MGKEKKGLNPADAFRKEQKKADAAKAKKERETNKSVRDLLNDPAKIELEIAKLEKQSNENRLDKSLKDKIKEMKHMLSVAQTKEKLKNRTCGNNDSSSSTSNATSDKPKLSSVGMRPEDSVYFHPLYNPTGHPPPGQPPLYRQSGAPPPPVQQPIQRIHPPAPRPMAIAMGGQNGIPMPPPRPQGPAGIAPPLVPAGFQYQQMPYHLQHFYQYSGALQSQLQPPPPPPAPPLSAPPLSAASTMSTAPPPPPPPAQFTGTQQAGSAHSSGSGGSSAAGDLPRIGRPARSAARLMNTADPLDPSAMGYCHRFKAPDSEEQAILERLQHHQQISLEHNAEHNEQSTDAPTLHNAWGAVSPPAEHVSKVTVMSDGVTVEDVGTDDDECDDLAEVPSMRPDDLDMTEPSVGPSLPTDSYQELPSVEELLRRRFLIQPSEEEEATGADNSCDVAYMPDVGPSRAAPTSCASYPQPEALLALGTGSGSVTHVVPGQALASLLGDYGSDSDSDDDDDNNVDNPNSRTTDKPSQPVQRSRDDCDDHDDHSQPGMIARVSGFSTNATSHVTDSTSSTVGGLKTVKTDAAVRALVPTSLRHKRPATTTAAGGAAKVIKTLAQAPDSKTLAHAASAVQSGGSGAGSRGGAVDDAYKLFLEEISALTAE